jgi:two-component system response regulator RegX3
VSARILLVDDEPDILQPVSYALRQQGFEVDCVGDGETALERARSSRYHLLICDVMLPGILGTDVCRLLRAESTLPIILLTAKDAELDRVVGLELGADDYVTKPFSSAELISRVRALLRRRQLDLSDASGATTVTVGGLEIDLTRHRVGVDGQADVQLTPSEFKLLAFLAEQPERVFSREQIMEHLWEAPYVGDARACDVHISNLRRKLERDPANPERIVTVREFGYKLVPA